LSHDTFTALLDDGTYTKSSLLALAANTTLTEALVTANSVDLIGVPGSADGEILASHSRTEAGLFHGTLKKA